MDNAYHALIMAGSVLLFIIGLTSAVYNYNKVLEVNDKILTNSEQYDRDAENFQYTEYYETDSESKLNMANMERTYTGAEIANMIFNMYTVKQIDVGTGQAVPQKPGVERDDPGPYTTPSTQRQVVNSDIAYSKIIVDGIAYDRDSNELAQRLRKIESMSEKDANGKPIRYKITESTFNGSESVVTFERVSDNDF